MKPFHFRDRRSAVRVILVLLAEMCAFVTFTVFAVSVGRTLSPRGEWLDDGPFALGVVLIWFLVTAVNVLVVVYAVDWLFGLFWPLPEDGHDR